MSELLNSLSSHSSYKPNINHLNKDLGAPEVIPFVNEQKSEKLGIDIAKNKEKKDIIEETKDAKQNLNKDIIIFRAKKDVYEKLWLNDDLSQNSSIENFEKWVVDELIISNWELAIDIINTKWEIILDIIKSLFSYEWLKKVAEWLWESIGNLFKWNSYEKWKSVAQLWLLALLAGWAWVAKLWANLARKEAILSAREAWREWRSQLWREWRNLLRDVGRKAEKLEYWANELDTTISTLWVNLLIKKWLNVNVQDETKVNETQEKSNNTIKEEEKLNLNWTDFIWLTTKEFNEKLINIINNNPDKKEFNFDWVDETTKHELKWKLYEIIWKNHPLLEVSRLIPWQKIVDVNFMWVKYINDHVWKEFVDLFTDAFKKELHKNFSKVSKGEEHWRVIREDYKHMTFSMENDLDIAKKIFWNKTDKKELFRKVFNNLDPNEIEKSLEWWKKEWLTKSKEWMSELESILLENFDIWVWSSNVRKATNETDEISVKEKLDTFYKAEIASKTPANLKNLWDEISYNFNKIKKISKNIIKVENEIVKKYKWEKFETGWTSYDVVVDWKINPILLRYARKWENINTKLDTSEIIIQNHSLQAKVNQYISDLNKWFDFISPVWNSEDFLKINELNNEINELKINPDAILNNYKWTLTKNSLDALTTWKEGIRVFIDIVDMWIMNLTDFRDLAWKIVGWKEIKWKKGINWKTITQIKEDKIDDLLDAGNTATNKFRALISNLKSDYPDVQLSLWWDEVFLFIPWKTQNETNDIIKNISSRLEQQNLKWRITSNFNKEKWNFDYLDWLTDINKLFEKSIESIIYKNNLEKHDNSNISSISLEISQKLKDKYLKKDDIEKKTASNEISPKDILLKKIKDIDKSELDKLIKKEVNEIKLEKNWLEITITRENWNIKININ